MLSAASDTEILTMLNGKWENELKSTMEIKATPTPGSGGLYGTLQGEYTTAVSSGGKSITAPLIGYWSAVQEADDGGAIVG